MGRPPPNEATPAEAITIWTPLAEAGHPEAQYWLAETYWGGWWDIPENFEQMAFWHLRTAEQGHAPSFVKLGHTHADGQHFARDDAPVAVCLRSGT